MEWLDRISITCFTASYLVVFLFEISRVFFHARFWKMLIIGMSIAGIFAHGVYLVRNTPFAISTQGLSAGSWGGWFLGAALVLMIAYVWAMFRQRDSMVGIFVIPLVLIAVAISNWPTQQSSFSPNEAKTIWNTVHGLALLLGTATVGLGFIYGILYLLQSWRLKKKIQLFVFRLPSLERLQKSSEYTLLVSVVLLTIGLVSGFAVNHANRQLGQVVVPWNDPVIWTSAILLSWLLAVLTFNLFYQPARQGRKVAYLVVSCFIFLVLELGVVWFSGHGTISAKHGLPVMGLSWLDQFEVPL